MGVSNTFFLLLVHKERMETQCCYVCGKYFEDKVKLGLHLTPCYNEAVSVRKELWHPHPLDLVDEQRYTEYMKGRYQQREQQITAAEKKGISFVSADTFEAMRGTLGPTRHNQNRPSTRERMAQVVAPHVPVPAYDNPPPVVLPGLPPSPPQSHQQQVAQPVRVVASGVTMLRNELHSEIEQLKKLREEEQLHAEIRNQQFHQLLTDFNKLKQGELPEHPSAPHSGPPNVVHPSAPQAGSASQPAQPVRATVPANPHHHSPLHDAQRPDHTAVLPTSSFAFPVSAPRDGSSPSRVSSAAPYATDVATPHEVLEDGRIRCGTCGKFFGKKGFHVHSQRCYRGAEDFTYSRDARFERNHPASGQPVPQLQATRYAPQGGDGGGRGDDGAWTQFMITYPRPVIDESPKTAKERNQAADAAKQKAEMNKMIAREMSGAPAPVEEREPTVPCGKCGRYFYTSRVAKHEVNCVAKKKR